MPDPSVIDPQAIENLRALNPDDDDAFVREIATLFLDDTPQRLTELDQSLSAGDAPKFTRAAHTIKGSSANLGAVGVRAAAERLEHQSRAEGLAAVAPLLAELKAEFARAHAELSKLIDRAKG